MKDSEIAYSEIKEKENLANAGFSIDGGMYTLDQVEGCIDDEMVFEYQEGEYWDPIYKRFERTRSYTIDSENEERRRSGLKNYIIL